VAQGQSPSPNRNSIGSDKLKAASWSDPSLSDAVVAAAAAAAVSEFPDPLNMVVAASSLAHLNEQLG
jgi:hypothetical protein